MKRRNFIGYSMLFLAACGTAQNTRIGTDAPMALKNPEKLRLAVTDTLSLDKLQRDYEPFRRSLEAVLGVKIEFFPVANTTAAASALQLNQVDLALAGPSEYVVIRARTNAVASAAITRPNYYSIIAVPATSTIKSLGELKGKKIALSDVGSTSGHLGPLKMLLDAQLNPQSDVTSLMLGDEGSVAAVKNGEADAWGGSAIDYREFFSAAEFPAIARSAPLPSDVLVTSSHLAPEFVEKITALMVANQEQLIAGLVAGESTKKYQGSQIVAAQDTDYEMIRQVYQALGQGDFLK